MFKLLSTSTKTFHTHGLSAVISSSTQRTPSLWFQFTKPSSRLERRSSFTLETLMELFHTVRITFLNIFCSSIFFFTSSILLTSSLVGTEAWITSMNLPIESLWQEWFISDDEGSQVAGYVTIYEGLTFATVKGAGHMVPQYAPEAAYYMFSNFINGKPL